MRAGGPANAFLPTPLGRTGVNKEGRTEGSLSLALQAEGGGLWPQGLEGGVEGLRKGI